MFNLEKEDSLMEVIHRKTGDRYYVDDIVIDATNDLEPEKQIKILYSNDKAERFVREAQEFFEKFDIPSGFNVLSKACESVLAKIEKFHNRVCCCESHECHCNNEKEYIGEMIDCDTYNTYTQTAETHWYAPLSIVRALAYNQLKELFTIRCAEFDIVRKDYDDATSDYFLVGYRTLDDFPKKIAQVCKLPKEVFDKIHSAIIDRESEDEKAETFY